MTFFVLDCVVSDEGVHLPCHHSKCILSVWFLDTCLGVSSFTLTDLSPHPPLPLSLSPFTPIHSWPFPPLGFIILPPCPPFFQLSWLLPTSSQLPAAPITSHLSTFHPFVSSLLSSLYISHFPSKLLNLLLFYLAVHGDMVPSVLSRWKCWSCPWHLGWKRLKLAFKRGLMRHDSDGHQLALAGGWVLWPGVDMWLYYPCSYIYINAFSSKFYLIHIPSVTPFVLASPCADTPI